MEPFTPDQLQRHGRGSRSGAVLAGQHQVLVGAAEVEVRVTEGMDVAGTAESLTGGHTRRGVFSGVMHEHHRQVQFPLQGAKVGQEPGHFAGMVLVDAVQPDQLVEVRRPRRGLG